MMDLRPEDLTILSFCISVFNAAQCYDEELVQKRIDELREFVEKEFMGDKVG